MAAEITVTGRRWCHRSTEVRCGLAGRPVTALGPVARQTRRASSCRRCSEAVRLGAHCGQSSGTRTTSTFLWCISSPTTPQCAEPSRRTGRSRPRPPSAESQRKASSNSHLDERLINHDCARSSRIACVRIELVCNCKRLGRVAEWFKAHAWKACGGESLSRVRISPRPWSIALDHAPLAIALAGGALSCVEAWSLIVVRSRGCCSPRPSCNVVGRPLAAELVCAGLCTGRGQGLRTGRRQGQKAFRYRINGEMVNRRVDRATVRGNACRLLLQHLCEIITQIDDTDCSVVPWARAVPQRYVSRHVKLQPVRLEVDNYVWALNRRCCDADGAIECTRGADHSCRGFRPQVPRACAEARRDMRRHKGAGASLSRAVADQENRQGHGHRQA